MIIKSKTPFGEDGCYYELIANPEDKVPFKGNGLLPKDAVVGSKLFLNSVEFTYRTYAEDEIWTWVSRLPNTEDLPIEATSFPICATLIEDLGIRGFRKLKIKIGTSAMMVEEIANSLSLQVTETLANGFTKEISGSDLVFSSDPTAGDVTAGTNYYTLSVKVNNRPPLYLKLEDADISTLASFGEAIFRNGRVCINMGGFYVPFEGTEDGYDSPAT